MHDIGRSGWSWLYVFIPVIGWIMILRWLATEGLDVPNKYGLPDNGASPTANLEDLEDNTKTKQDANK